MKIQTTQTTDLSKASFPKKTKDMRKLIRNFKKNKGDK